jgi:hypothetical protein
VAQYPLPRADGSQVVLVRKVEFDSVAKRFSMILISKVSWFVFGGVLMIVVRVAAIANRRWFARFRNPTTQLPQLGGY